MALLENRFYSHFLFSDSKVCAHHIVVFRVHDLDLQPRKPLPFNRNVPVVPQLLFDRSVSSKSVINTYENQSNFQDSPP